MKGAVQNSCLIFAMLLAVTAMGPARSSAQPVASRSIGQPSAIDLNPGKPRVLVLTDIGNEPDDQMSFVRLLLYANEIDIEGIVAVTSTWQRTETHAETLREIVESYGDVRSNLLLHAKGWPTVATLAARISVGQPAYGMAAVGSGHRSAGANAIIKAVDSPDSRPLWVSVWGGANTLAQALHEVRATRSPDDLAAFHLQAPRRFDIGPG